MHYVSSDECTNEFINSIRDDTDDTFLKWYREMDTRMVDDIQFLTGKELTQEEFFPHVQYDRPAAATPNPPTHATAAWSATPSSTARPNPTPTAACTSAASSSSSRTTATASPAASTAKAPPAKPSTHAPSR
nr:hypothetical protein HEP87_56320 [Streptomyces sp. S1D4-11]